MQQSSWRSATHPARLSHPISTQLCVQTVCHWLRQCFSATGWLGSGCCCLASILSHLSQQLAPRMCHQTLGASCRVSAGVSGSFPCGKLTPATPGSPPPLVLQPLAPFSLKLDVKFACGKGFLELVFPSAGDFDKFPLPQQICLKFFSTEAITRILSNPFQQIPADSTRTSGIDFAQFRATHPSSEPFLIQLPFDACAMCAMR